MRRKLFLLGLALVFLAQGPVVLAIDCSAISQQNYQICLGILNFNLSLEEKGALISNLEYNSKFFPDYDYIYFRNTALQIKDAPNGVNKHDSLYIKEAWASIFAVMPSVIYNNSLFVPYKTSVFTGFNYKLLIPPDYASPGYPNTDQGDCKRTYLLANNFSENKIFVNNIYQGSGKSADVSITKDANITINYLIGADVSISHYKWRGYCCKRSNGQCIRHCYSCDYSSTETKNDRLTINDLLNVKLYGNSLIAEVMPIDSYGSNTKLKINYSNSIEIDLNNSYFDFYQYIFSVNYSKEPYYIYTLKAEDYNQEKFSNLIRNSDTLIVKNAKDCRVRAFDLFNVIQANCNSNYLGFDFNISVDKFYYSDNQTIKVYISPSDISLLLEYGNESKNAANITYFTAEYPINKITAYFDGRKYEKIIFVYDKSKVLLLWELIMFFLLVYFAYKILNKIYRRSK